MATVTVSWRSDLDHSVLAALMVRDVLPAFGRPGEHWWEVSVIHREGIPDTHVVAASDWLAAADAVIEKVLPTADPDLAATLILLRPRFAKPVS